MKLGTQTGSVINHLHSRAVIGQPEPTVGMAVTMLAWTDRHAGTIVAVETDKNGTVYVHATRDAYTVTSGSEADGSAEYTYTPNPDGGRYTFRREADGKWTEVVRKALAWDDEGNVTKRSPRWSVSRNGYGLRIGAREVYRDPSF